MSLAQNFQISRTAWEVFKREVFLVRIFPYSVQIWENTDQKNTVFGHFLRSVGATGSLPFWRNFSRPPGLPIFASDIASKQSKKIQKNPFSKKYFSVNRITPSNGGSRMRKYWIEHHCIWFRDFYHTVAVTINQQA